MWLDVDLLVYTLLRRIAPEGTAVTAETDSEVLGDLPLWTFSVIGDGQAANGPGLWSINLDVSVFALGLDAAKAAAGVAYDGIHRWGTDPASSIVPALGWVAAVDDNSLFSLQGSPEITGLHVSQYAGSFALALRK
jgi:hypothetical protein